MILYIYMSNNYFSPNQKITGGAAFFSFNSKEGAVYIKLLKQVAMNQDKKNNFDGANPINVKLGQDEVADLIRAIRTSSESKFFHQFNDTKTSGSFKFYTVPANGTFPAKNGFGLSVKKTADGKEQEIKVGFTLGGAERLSLYLQNALVHIFDAEYSQDLKDAKEYLEKKKSLNPKETEQQEPETNGDF